MKLRKFIRNEKIKHNDYSYAAHTVWQKIPTIKIFGKEKLGTFNLMEHALPGNT